MKIALCCPAYGDTKAKFTQSLVNMVNYTLRSKIELDGVAVVPEIDLFMVSCSLLPESRNALVVEAINWGADYMLWLDADHVFPPDALMQLLSRNELVVGVNYARRANPTSPTASKMIDGVETLLYTTKERFEEGEVEDCMHFGLGFCLMDMRVFAVLEHQALEAGKEHFWPLFVIEPQACGIKMTGEDVYFFKKIRDAGIPVHIDHKLSWDIGHIGETIITNAHAQVDKPKLAAAKAKRMARFTQEAA